MAFGRVAQNQTDNKQKKERERAADSTDSKYTRIFTEGKELFILK